MPSSSACPLIVVKPSSISGNRHFHLLVVASISAASRDEQPKALKEDGTLTGCPRRAAWVKLAEARVREEGPMSARPIMQVGKFENYWTELELTGQPVVVAPSSRRPLAHLRSGEFLSRDLAHQVKLEGEKVLVTWSGQGTETLPPIGNHSVVPQQ